MSKQKRRAKRWKNMSALHKNWLESDHEWENNKGYVDMFVTSEGHHNGPRCVRCGFTACWHCIDTPPPCKPARQKGEARR